MLRTGFEPLVMESIGSRGRRSTTSRLIGSLIDWLIDRVSEWVNEWVSEWMNNHVHVYLFVLYNYFVVCPFSVYPCLEFNRWTTAPPATSSSTGQTQQSFLHLLYNDDAICNGDAQMASKHRHLDICDVIYWRDGIIAVAHVVLLHKVCPAVDRW